MLLEVVTAFVLFSHGGLFCWLHLWTLLDVCVFSSGSRQADVWNFRCIFRLQLEQCTPLPA